MGGRRFLKCGCSFLWAAFSFLRAIGLLLWSIGPSFGVHAAFFGMLLAFLRSSPCSVKGWDLSFGVVFVVSRGRSFLSGVFPVQPQSVVVGSFLWVCRAFQRGAAPFLCGAGVFLCGGSPMWGSWAPFFEVSLWFFRAAAGWSFLLVLTSFLPSDVLFLLALARSTRPGSTRRKSGTPEESTQTPEESAATG